jgi:hypothetical protein
MNKIIYVIGIAIMWAAWATAFYLIKDWEFFKSIVILFVAAGVAFGYGTLVLIIKALR